VFKRIKLIVLFFILCALTLSSGCGSSFVIKDKYTINANNITFTDFSKDISTDEIYNTIKKFSAKDDARITGFEGEKTSAEYIANQFKEMGFNVTEQSFPIKSYSCSGTEVDIIATESKKISSHFLTYSKATPKEGITADVVFGGIGTESELENADVKDKIVLMKRGGDLFRVKTQRAFTKGVVGAIFYDPGQ
jgi:aminopeptidase YwaD